MNASFRSAALWLLLSCFGCASDGPDADGGAGGRIDVTGFAGMTGGSTAAAGATTRPRSKDDLMELSGPRLDPAEGGPARSAVLLLHGYGADGNDLIGLAAEWAPALPETMFFSPHAPYPCEASSFGRQWFGFQDKSRHLVAMEVATAAQVIDSTIDSLLAELSIAPGPPCSAIPASNHAAATCRLRTSNIDSGSSSPPPAR